MAKRSAAPRLSDIIEAIERVRDALGEMPLDAFEADWRCQRLIERGLEIIPESGRRLPAEPKARHPEIPWQKVAGIGNVLRHDYESVSAPIIWKLVRDDLPHLEQVCREELGREAHTGSPPADKPPSDN